MPIQYTDFDITKRHAAIIESEWPDSVKVQRPEVRKTIPGVKGTRITEGVRTGIWMKPLGRKTAKSWSSIRDIRRSTMVLFVLGSTTSLNDEQQPYEVIRELITELFDDRRGTKLCGELISTVSVGNYDVDDKLSRTYDIDVLVITSTFREDKTFGS
jgi:hypothetical protein